MKELKDFISNFLSRSGSYVFASTILSRLLSFFASWIALQMIPNKELGIVIYAFQIILFIIPIGSLGLNQGLLRYGSLLESIDDKNNLFFYVLKNGILVSLLLIILIILSSFLINFQHENTRFYLILLSLAITSNFVFELINIQLRLHMNNKLFSIAEFTYNLLLVFFVFTLSYRFQELGYAISLVITPLITSLLFIKKLNIKIKGISTPNIVDFTFWRYGFFASLSNVTTQLLFSIDIILIGSLLKNMEAVTAFKYVSLIPFSLLFLSKVVITTDFVNFTEQIKNKTYIKAYIKSYIKLFTIISLVCISVISLFGSTILSFFEEDYESYQSTLIILTIGITGILILRGLFGNLLSSIGKAHVNFIITSIALILNLGFNYYLIPKYGLLGAAITSSFLMWFTGILSLLLFYYFFNKMNSSKN
ncbi:polysaccharide biosynthesis C-terminal domain-containing protein [uncultured Lutibacter sp.]|uniref:polysaccharide biosynthesis C-terminal domain-containing protein n=1 Tax=uncultured Lutibacter sp. TaxID=437739 RepID=UPI00262180AC|nr:polysaccharide biosynthesis C-terminal domain-containing protein [uncultured Lutibacter sp.]